MATEIKVPVLPESVSDATIATWHKKAGDAVKRDENIVDPVSYTHLTLPTILRV